MSLPKRYKHQSKQYGYCWLLETSTVQLDQSRRRNRRQETHTKEMSGLFSKRFQAFPSYMNQKIKSVRQLTGPVFRAAGELILRDGQMYTSHKLDILYEYNPVARGNMKVHPA
jgi:hypothetical protein